MVRFLSTMLLMAGSTLALGNEPTPALPPAPRSIIVQPISDTPTPAAKNVQQEPAPLPAQADEFKAATENQLRKTRRVTAANPCRVTVCNPCRATACNCNPCRCCEPFPVLSFVKRELVDKPVNGVKSALNAAEDRRVEKAECRLSRAACRCGNDPCCQQKLAGRFERLVEEKARVESKRAELSAESNELYSH